MTTTIGVITDIHANKYALDAVLDDMQTVDELICLGDVVGYGPDPKDCIDRVRTVTDTILRGNHEVFLENPDKCRSHAEAYPAIQHAKNELSNEDLSELASLPYKTTRTIDGTTVLFVHGHPDDAAPFQYIKESNAHELASHVNEHKWHTLAAGHSHIQFTHRITNTGPDMHDAVIFNPGSVGQPRDGDPRAAYAVMTISQDSMYPEIDLHRVDYDINAAIQAVENAGLPAASGTRLEHGKHPRTMSQRTRPRNRPRNHRR